MAASTLSLIDLPVEILLEIFSYLRVGHSTCLGLASKRLYAIHCFLRPLGTIRLETPCPTRGSKASRLYEVLGGWYPPGFEYCWNEQSRSGMYVTQCHV
jgi:hypothetical protein